MLPPRPRVALVGSRAATRAHLAAIPTLVELVAARGLCVVSGGARGVDAAAHRAALQLGVPQLVVLPTGADRIYPPEHEELFERIARAPYSGVLFGAARNSTPSRGLFASRNRIVIEAADAIVVVQAARRSGSAGTGSLALRRGARVAAFTSSAGGEALVGAGALSLGDPGVAGWVPRAEVFLDALIGVERETIPLRWPTHLRWLADALAQAPPEGSSVDAFADALETLCALTEASTLGLVVEVTPGRYRLAQ